MNKNFRVIFFIALIQTWYSIGFFILFATLTLYCIHGLQIPDYTAYLISTSFLALVYALAVFGGYLANRWLGYYLAAFTGIALSTLGFFCLLITNLHSLYYGLAMIAVSEGMTIPTLYVLLGMLYKDGSGNRSKGFTIAYVGMNIGCFIGSAISGPIAEHFGYYSIFSVGLFSSILTLCIFLLYYFSTRKSDKSGIKCEEDKSISSILIGLFITLCSIPVVGTIISHPQWGHSILLGIGILAFGIIISLAKSENSLIRKKMKLFLFLCILYICFWALYFIIPTILPLFIERNVNRNVFGLIIPASSFYALNPLLIILLGPVMGAFWAFFSKKNLLTSFTEKFALGLILMGMGYLVLSVGILTHNDLGFVSWIWIALSYLIQTLGELCIGPIGYAMVGEVAPREHEGLMMGIWQLMAGIAGAITSFLSSFLSKMNGMSLTPLATNSNYSHFFLLCGGTVAIIGIITAILTRLNTKRTKIG